MTTYGLIGYPVRHSLSPAMHNAAFAHLKIDAEYRLFEISPEQLEKFLEENIEVRDTAGRPCRSQEISGFNITIPHKVRASEILLKDGCTLKENIPSREDHYVFVSGAINTVKRDKDRLEYYNTDAPGFMKSLEEDLRFVTRNKNIIIFGCGGAGRAVVAGLTWKTDINRIYIYDTSAEAIVSAKQHFGRFEFLKDKLEFISAGQLPQKLQEADLLVNASSVGMKAGDGSPVEKKLLHEKLCVYDIVYNRETQLVKDTRSLGLLATNGLSMLLYQGVGAFEFWTAISAPVQIMRRALEEGVNKL